MLSSSAPASSSGSLPSSNTARRVGFAIFTAIAVLFAFYGVYWAQALVPLPPEDAALRLAQDGAGYGYPFILGVWQVLAGDTLLAARLLSVACGGLALVLWFRIARQLSGDPVIAAFLTLSFVLYPPLVAAFAMATPHALFVLLALGVLSVMLRGAAATPQLQRASGLWAGVLSGVGVMMHPLAPVLMPLWLVCCGILTVRGQSFIVALTLTLLALMAVMWLGPPPIGDADLSVAGHATLLSALVLPYAMVGVGLTLSFIAIWAAAVRSGLGLARICVALLGPVVGVGVLLAAAATDWYAPGQLVTAVACSFPFLLLAPWPLAFWVRNGMPQVKSLAAWIVFPVVMYSCFWVVLGPIDPGKFPYSHRQVTQPAPSFNR